jgi:phosphate-selective porin OprO and OprP
MSFTGGTVAGRRTGTGLLAFLVSAVLANAFLHSQVHAADASQTGSHPPPTLLAEGESGPEALKHQVRITVETNAVPGGAATNRATPKEKAFEWRSSWEGWDGLHLELAQKTRLEDPLAEVREKIQGTNAYRVFHLEALKMTAKIGGRLAVDGAAYVTGKEFTGFDAGVEVRRARVYAMGDCILLLPVSYQIEIGYIPDQFYLEETYLLFRNLPWIGDLKGGQYKAPMGLDIITSSRDIPFMEPAAPLEALAPGVNAGIEVGRPVFHQRATWRAGLFTDGVGQDFGDATKDYGRAIIRFTGLPLYKANPEQPDSSRLLHLGLSANLLYSASSSVRYQSRPESHLAPYVVDTGDIAADGALVVGAEAAWVNGPFSVQGEYLHSSVRENNGEVPDFNGFYALASWFLTGESRPYDRNEGKFGRIVPKRDFDFGRGGWGAWELAGRYSFVNLDSADIHGGRLSMLMAEVNWYLHSHVKWRFNYGFGHVSGRQPEGNLNIFQTRVEVDF